MSTPIRPDVLAVGPRPEGAGFPRWIQRAEVPDSPLPDRSTYLCRRSVDVVIDGDVESKPWPWTSLGDIRTGGSVPLRSRVAMLWDDDHLYAAFDFADPDPEAFATEPGSHVYAFDTTAEFFVGGPDGYHEWGVNSIGVGYELRWFLVDPLVARGDMAAVDALLRIPNFLYYPPQRIEPGKVGDLDFRMPGLVHAERVDAEGWAVELAMPWESIRAITGLPAPRAGGAFPAQAMRAHHREEERARARQALAAGDGDGRSPADLWTLSTQGNVNVHNVSRWARVTLSDDPAS